mgnify:FL=1
MGYSKIDLKRVGELERDLAWCREDLEKEREIVRVTRGIGWRRRDEMASEMSRLNKKIIELESEELSEARRLKRTSDYCKEITTLFRSLSVLGVIVASLLCYVYFL